MAPPEEALRTRWRQFMAHGSVLPEGAAESVIDEVLARHREPVRRYHTATHVVRVLHHVDELLAQATRAIDGDAVRAAAVFHDVVYDPRSATNERDSALLAAEALRELGWREPRIELVVRLIEATAGHDADSPEAMVLLDADLAVLGAAPAAYARYVDAVRAEYGHVSDSDWVVGRAEVLESFLARGRIYRTAEMAARRESQARRNLSSELATLRGSA